MEDEIREALESVIDPEVGINVVDLGLIRGLAVEDGAVRVTMTMTTPACPLGPYLQEEVVAAVQRALPEVRSVDVQLVWDPPWTPEAMSEDARRQLGWG